MATERDIEAILALSPLQQGLLFHTLLDPKLDPYFIHTGFTLEGPLAPAVFARAWSDLIERHAILRTGFAWRDLSRPVQVVRRQAALHLSQEDWREHGAAEQDRRLAAWLSADREQGFVLLEPPLLRLALFRRAEQTWSFVISHHHLLLDGWSFARLLGEALESYERRRVGQPPPAAGTRSFRDYLGWLEAQSPAQAERFFRAQLAEFSRPTPLPFAAAATASAAAGYSEHALSFSVAETRALSDCARRLRVTLNTLLQGAWALLLARHAGEREVVFGTTVSGRPAELAGADSIIGLLINTLPVRVQVEPGQPLGSWLQQLQLWNGELRQYEWAPLPRIQGWSGVPNGRALFDSVLVFDSYPEPEGGSNPGGIEVRALDLDVLRQGAVHLGRNNYPMSLIVEPNAELRLVLSHQTARLEAGAGRQLLEQCRSLLLGFLGSPERRLGELAWGEGVAPHAQGPARSFGGPSTVHGLLDWHAAQNPDSLAVVSERESLRYGELQARAACLAEALRERGVGDEDRVALLVERSAALAVGIFGVLKAGAAYVPIDPKWPAARAAQIVADSGARVVAYGQAHAGLALSLGLPAVCLQELPRVPSAAAPALGTVQPERAAYLIYTSGSTGRPKGVVVEHRQLVNYVQAVLERLRLEPAARLGLVSTVAADLGHTSLFGALCSGRTLHVVSDEHTFDPTAFAEHLERQPIDALKIVPSHLHALLEAERPERALPRSCLVIGGETAPRELLERVRALRPECRVVNHYGPTETTVGALTWELAADQPPGPLPIGRPIANLRACVLDDELRPVPEGVPGELYLGGAGVARGYHQRPGLTAERFIPDPHDGAFGQRLYRTGDRARRRGDGAIEFLGRTDHQIKLRGHRIELGEIEAALCEAGARQAVVLVRSVGGADRLVAYVVPRQQDAFSSEAALRELGRRLPDYMLPSHIVALGQLPLTRNGKIDRAALPEPEAAGAPCERVAPRTELEATLAQIWAEILLQPEVGVHDNFFALGGDSIRSLQIIASASRRGVRITPKQMFAHPTIAALAKSLGTEQPVPAQQPPPKPFGLSRLPTEQLTQLLELHGPEIEDVYPASAVQQGMLIHGLLRPEDAPYLNQVVYRFSRGLDVEAFASAWRRLSAAHPALRTSFVVDGVSEPHQLVWRNATLPMEHLDWRGLSAERQAVELRAQLSSDRVRGLPLERRPLMRWTVVRTGEVSHEVIWTVHHAILDGWCQARLIKDWLALYAGREPESPLDAAPPYRAYVAWLESRDVARAESFFRRYLKGYAAPLRLPAPGSRADGTAGCRESRLKIPARWVRGLEQQARDSEVTLNTLVQAAWALTLSRFGGGRDVLFGVTVSGRPVDLPGSEAVLGVFINSLPLRSSIEPAQRGRDWLRQLQDTNLELREFEATPPADVQRWSEPGPGTALFDTLLVFQNYPLDAALADHASAIGVEVCAEEAWTHYPLTLFVYPGSELDIVFSWHVAALAAPALEGLMKLMQAALERIAERPDARVADWLAPPAGEIAALRACNATERRFLPEQGVLSVLEQRARRHPERLAVSSGERALTYAALELRSNQLARRLAKMNIGTESRVGLALSPSVDLLVAVLGVLKVGAAYVPLDPSYPRERLRYMVEDARLELLLSELALLDSFPAQGVSTLCLDSPAHDLASESGTALAVPHLAEALAYVIYTSGSTGQPKGVMVRRGGLDNFLGAMQELLAPPEGVVLLAATSLSFDIAVLELLLPLCAGGRVVIAPAEARRDPESMVTLIRSSGATWLQATPSAWGMLLEVDRTFLPGLTVLSGGEALAVKLGEALVTAAAAWNLYGPTETTVWSSAHRLGSLEDGVPLGQPIANTALYVLDARLDPVPAGVAGELYIGGQGLARGYARRPALTAERFVPDPFGAEPGGRLYRTGDIALRQADGRLEFLGRLDHQLKIRGYRIELGEIEARLGQHPGVRDVAVLAELAGDHPQLAAFVSTVSGVELTREQLQCHLRQSLPDYMVPARFAFLPALPLTPNGKVDRRALAGLAQPETRAADATPPRNELEAAVVGIWQEVLGSPSAPGIFDNFFDLGGHSLLATRVMSRVRARFRSELPLRALFEAPTAAEFAARVAQAQGRGRPSQPLPPLVAAPRPERLPLSFAQRGLWFEQQLPQPPGAFVIPFLLELQGQLEPRALQHALQALVQRHEILRTAILVERGEPHQQVLAELRLELPSCDLTELAPELVEPELAARMAAIQGAPFDLARPPLLRAQLFRLAPERHALALAVHHIVADAWSLALLVRELKEGYRQARSARSTAAPPAPVLHYADYALWQRQPALGERHEAQLAYWKQRLAGAPRWLTLPGQGSGAGGAPRAERFRRRLSGATAAAVATLAERRGSTPFLVLGAVLAVLMQQQTGTTDLCIGTDVAGRPLAESEGIVGFFVNQLVLRVDIQPELTFGELLAAHTQGALEAYEHQELPFERLVAELGARRGADQPPLFQLKLLMANAPQRDLELDGLVVVERELPPGGSEVDLLINAQLTPGELELVFDYRRDLYAPDYVTQLAELYAQLLSLATQAPERRVEELVAALRAHQAQLDARARAEQQARLAQARSALGSGTRRAAVRVPESAASDRERNPSDV